MCGFIWFRGLFLNFFCGLIACFVVDMIELLVGLCWLCVVYLGLHGLCGFCVDKFFLWFNYVVHDVSGLNGLIKLWMVAVRFCVVAVRFLWLQ